MPYIVMMIDMEMSDLMATAGKKVKTTFKNCQNITILPVFISCGTQRPSVDVITGTIKTNFHKDIFFS